MSLKSFSQFIYIITIIFLAFSCKKNPTPSMGAVGTWSKKKDFVGDSRIFMTGFSVNGKGYVVGGLDDNFGTTTFRNLWQYDPITNTWSEQASLPDGKERSSAASFVINGKAYVAAGHKTQNYFNDLWQYDPANNSWVQKSSLPQGLGRDNPIGFTLNNKGYITLGNGMIDPFTDLWEYDPENDTWTQKASLPANKKRLLATSFILNGKAYVVGGQIFNGFTILGDVLQYDPEQNIWIEKASLPAGKERAGAISFVVNNKAYLVGGFSNTQQGNVFLIQNKEDVLEYDSSKDEWKVLGVLPEDVKRYYAASFVINNTAYIVGGISKGNYLPSLFEFIF